MTIAQTILAQLGGNKFLAMTGAKNLLRLDKGLQFDLPRGAANKANRVQIVLSPSDLYTVAFYKARGLNCDKIGADTHGLFADALRPTFEAATGLRTAL